MAFVNVGPYAALSLRLVFTIFNWAFEILVLSTFKCNMIIQRRLVFVRFTAHLWTTIKTYKNNILIKKKQYFLCILLENKALLVYNKK